MFIAYFIATYKVSAVLLAHNHPYGSCHPSQQDLASHERLASIFQFAGCRLLDNLIVGYDGIYSLEKYGIQRIFLDSEEAYNEAIKQLKNK